MLYSINFYEIRGTMKEGYHILGTFPLFGYVELPNHLMDNQIIEVLQDRDAVTGVTQSTHGFKDRREPLPSDFKVEYVEDTMNITYIPTGMPICILRFLQNTEEGYHPDLQRGEIPTYYTGFINASTYDGEACPECGEEITVRCDGKTTCPHCGQKNVLPCAVCTSYNGMMCDSNCPFTKGE